MKKLQVLSLILLLCCCSMSDAQQLVATDTTVAVPPLMNFSSVLSDGNSKAITAETAVTFLLYKESQGGSPLWMESQNVKPDNTGHYTVMLGATSSQGLPAEIFVAGQAHWLAVHVQGQEESPRVLLVSAPYALKAGDAQTLGGLPASAYMLAAPPSTGALTGTVSGGTTSPMKSSATQSPATPNSPVTTAGGTSGKIPLWDSTTDITSSIITQTGSGSSAKLGINIANPLLALDVNGGELVRGLFEMATSGLATASKGFISNPLNIESSAFNSSTAKYTLNHFQWQAEPVGNNTAAPGATLNLLYGQDPNPPTETGLKLASNGQFTFAAGQKFPGTGTITGVTAGSGLTGGGTSGTVTVSVKTAGITNSMLQHSSITVNPGTDLTGGGGVSLGGSITLNLDTTRVPTLAAANTFGASQSIVGSLFPDVTGTNNSSFAPGIVFGGTGSGETITSNRTNSFFNQFGLDFYTAFTPRMSIYQDGTIGFGASILKFGGTQVFIDPPAGDNSNVGIIALGQETFDSGFSGGDGVHGSGGSGSSGGFDGTGGVFFGGCCAGDGNGLLVFPGSGIAAFFEGDVSVFGNLSKEGGSFKIDHPLDPGNKYLYHSFVESPDMKNIYDGVATLNGNGEAVVQLPDWFDALNRDFRYQLTAIGAPGPNLYISQEISGNHFAIAGGKPGSKVSWQVTGTRQDAWANAHRIPVEEEKSAQERGYYMAPELFGQAPEKQIVYARHPDMIRRHKAVTEQSHKAARAAQQNQLKRPPFEKLARPVGQPSSLSN